MNPEKDEIIKNEILIQAQKLFQQFGLKKTTMDEIAAACGKAKSTIYYYYKSKEEVFEAVILLEMVNLRKFVKNKVEEHKRLEDKIRTYVVEFHKEVIKKVNLYRIIRQDHLAENKARGIFNRMVDYEKSYIIRILEDGYDAGEYRDIAREDIPWISEIFLAAFYGTVEYIVEKDGYFDEEKLVKITDVLVPKLFR
ncbi:TetR/AcrR family transcriptional regulator [Gaoshiqia sp. Z1-71]|uniref:TetR/AcrR family transcriptional regulator n=1 Tax=Gaoshiqia hydrogeniformans TaxID=3290090 RepID=UPI003BF7D481